MNIEQQIKELLDKLYKLVKVKRVIYSHPDFIDTTTGEVLLSDDEMKWIEENYPKFRGHLTEISYESLHPGVL